MDAKPPSSAAPGAGPSITDADRELAREMLLALFGEAERVDVEVGAIHCAAAREAGEAKGRAEEREECADVCKAQADMYRDGSDEAEAAGEPDRVMEDCELSAEVAEGCERAIRARGEASNG